MQREDAISLVRQLEDAVNAHDTPRLLELYADSAVMVSPVFSGITGLEAIAKTWETVFSLFPDWTAKVSDILVDGDRIAFLGTAGATDRSGWFGEPATGERIEYRAVIVLTMSHGKIIRDERIYDLTGVLQRLEKSRLDKELRVAAEVQRALLSRTSQVTGYCEAVGDSIPSRAIGGDFFDLINLPSGNFGIVLGDVAGKGPASAIIAAVIQGMLGIEVENENSPAATVTRLNRGLVRRNLEPRFATLVYGVLSPDGRFVYSNAGHNAAIVLTSDGLHRLTTGGSILGAFTEARFDEETVHMRPGDTLIMFSDGVTEARNAHGVEFGESRLLTFVKSIATNPVPDVLRAILARVQDFCQGSTQTDDRTVTVARYRGL
jgi:ketosteroid isomerase-like protein